MALTPRSELDGIRWIVYRNASGFTIPGFGLVRSSDVDAYDIFQGKAPNAASDNCLWFNNAVDVPNNAYGTFTKDFPWYVLYQVSDGTPIAGQSWGSIAGTGALAADWVLHRASSGFIIFGNPNNGRVSAGCTCT